MNPESVDTFGRRRAKPVEATTGSGSSPWILAWAWRPGLTVQSSTSPERGRRRARLGASANLHIRVADQSIRPFVTAEISRYRNSKSIGVDVPKVSGWIVQRESRDVIGCAVRTCSPVYEMHLAAASLSPAVLFTMSRGKESCSGARVSLMRVSTTTAVRNKRREPYRY